MLQLACPCGILRIHSWYTFATQKNLAIHIRILEAVENSVLPNWSQHQVCLMAKRLGSNLEIVYMDVTKKQTVEKIKPGFSALLLEDLHTCLRIGAERGSGPSRYVAWITHALCSSTSATGTHSLWIPFRACMLLPKRRSSKCSARVQSKERPFFPCATEAEALAGTLR